MVTAPPSVYNPPFSMNSPHPAGGFGELGVLRRGRPASFTAQLPGCSTYPRGSAFAIQAHTQSPARPSTRPPLVRAAGPARACQWCLGYRTAGCETGRRLGSSLPYHLLVRISLAPREMPSQDRMEMGCLVKKHLVVSHASVDCWCGFLKNHRPWL